MASSIFTESEAPRDFRVSSTESDGHYKKCLLCYTVKKNFYCAECIRTGSFVHSSMPYSDRYAEKQAKLLRLKANRRHVLERCEKLLAPKIKHDSLLTEVKQSRDRIDLLRLAIEQRRNNIEEKKKELSQLVQHNKELRLKLPRYQKRVASFEKHAQNQRMELQNKICAYHDRAQALAALRRSRIRQLTKYIFPLYITYDSSDSIEDLEFLGEEAVEEPPARPQLHIVAPWIHADGDLAHVQAYVSCKEPGAGGGGAGVEGGAGAGAAVGGGGGVVPAAVRCAAALGLCAQLVALLAYTLDVRLPQTLALDEYCNWRVNAGGLAWRWRRLGASCAALCARGGVAPRGGGGGGVTPLAGLDALCTAAAADSEYLGRVEAWLSPEVAAAWGGWEGGEAEGDDEPPEHLHWPEHEQEPEELSSSPPAPNAPPASLVTSAVGSIVSMWRGWTK